jgi:hypothetical protein
MSYTHCPICQRAYNLAINAACPSCPVAATVVDATADIVAAADQLARAIGRATPSERAAAAVRLDRLALPAAGAAPADPIVARSIRAVLAPPPIAPAQERPLLAKVISLVDRIAPRLSRIPTPQLVRRVLSRVRALAA